MKRNLLIISGAIGLIGLLATACGPLVTSGPDVMVGGGIYPAPWLNPPLNNPNMYRPGAPNGPGFIPGGYPGRPPGGNIGIYPGRPPGNPGNPGNNVGMNPGNPGRPGNVGAPNPGNNRVPGTGIGGGNPGGGGGNGPMLPPNNGGGNPGRGPGGPNL